MVCLGHVMYVIIIQGGLSLSLSSREQNRTAQHISAVKCSARQNRSASASFSLLAFWTSLVPSFQEVSDISEFQNEQSCSAFLADWENRTFGWISEQNFSEKRSHGYLLSLEGALPWYLALPQLNGRYLNLIMWFICRFMVKKRSTQKYSTRIGQ